MAMKKNIVHVSYHTYVDAVVYADESVSYEDVLELGRQKAADNSKEVIEELLSNCEEDGNTQIVTFREDAFINKNEAYESLFKNVEDAGYILIEKTKRPTFTINDEGVFKDITIKSLVVVGFDESSPLRMIDENDEMWDVDDYLGQDDITELYAIVENWY